MREFHEHTVSSAVTPCGAAAPRRTIHQELPRWHAPQDRESLSRLIRLPLDTSAGRSWHRGIRCRVVAYDHEQETRLLRCLPEAHAPREAAVETVGILACHR